MIKLLQGTEALTGENVTTVNDVTNASTTVGGTPQPPKTNTEMPEPQKAANENKQAQQQQQGSPWTFWIMIAAMILIMYFFMWRPEKKRRKQMEEFRNSLKAGDKVITAGGIYAIVKKVEETSLLIEVDSNVTLRIDKNMVVAMPAAPEK